MVKKLISIIQAQAGKNDMHGRGANVFINNIWHLAVIKGHLKSMLFLAYAERKASLLKGKLHHTQVMNSQASVL